MNKTKNALERTVELLSKTPKIFVKGPIIEYCTDTFQLVHQGHPIQRIIYPVIFRDIPCELKALNDLLASLVPNHTKHTLDKFGLEIRVNDQGRNCVYVAPGRIEIIETVGGFKRKESTMVYDNELIKELNLGESKQTQPLTERGSINREIQIFPFVNMCHYERHENLLRVCFTSPEMDMEEWCSYGGVYMSTDHLGKICIEKE